MYCMKQQPASGAAALTTMKLGQTPGELLLKAANVAKHPLGITYVDISKLAQRASEGSSLLCGDVKLLAIINSPVLLVSIEAGVLQKDDTSISRGGAGSLNLRSKGVLQESHRLVRQTLKGLPW